MRVHWVSPESLFGMDISPRSRPPVPAHEGLEKWWGTLAQEKFHHLPQITGIDLSKFEPGAPFEAACREVEKFGEELSLPEVEVTHEGDATFKHYTQTIRPLPPNPIFGLTASSRSVTVRIAGVKAAATTKKELNQLLETAERAVRYPDVLMALDILSREFTGKYRSPGLPEGVEAFTPQATQLNYIHTVKNHGDYSVIKPLYEVIIRDGRRYMQYHVANAVALGKIPPASVVNELIRTVHIPNLQVSAACPVLAREVARAVRDMHAYMPYGTPSLERKGATISVTGAKDGCPVTCPHLGECPYSGRKTSITPGVYNIAVWGKMAEMADLPVHVETGMSVKFRELSWDEYLVKPESPPYDETLLVDAPFAGLTGDPTHLALVSLQIAAYGVWTCPRLLRPYPHVLGQALLPVIAAAAGIPPEVLKGIYPIPEVVNACRESLDNPESTKQALVHHLQYGEIPPPYDEFARMYLLPGDGSLINGDI